MREDWCDIEYSVAVVKISTNRIKTKQKDYLPEGEIAIVDQGQELIGGYTNDTSKSIPCQLPVVVFGDHTKAIKHINFRFAPGADGTKVLQPKQFVDSKLLYYFTEVLVLLMEDKGYARHYQHVEKSTFPLPPLPEQRAIVGKLEQLFSELDSGIAELQRAQEKLKVYRQAVLKKAFEGELPQLKSTEITEIITDGDHQAPPKADTGIPFIVISNVKSNKIDFSDTRHVPDNYFNSLAEKKVPKRGDVLYTVTGSYGIPILIDFDRKFCFQRHIALLRPNDKVTSKYLFYLLQSPTTFKMAGDVATGTAQKTVSLTGIRTFIFPVPTKIEEQHQIVEAIESRLSVCDKLEESIATNLQKAEALRQSILKKAFEGRLLSTAELAACKKEKDWCPAGELLGGASARKKTAMAQ